MKRLNFSSLYHHVHVHVFVDADVCVCVCICVSVCVSVEVEVEVFFVISSMLLFYCFRCRRVLGRQFRLYWCCKQLQVYLLLCDNISLAPATSTDELELGAFLSRACVRVLFCILHSSSRASTSEP